MYEEVMDKKQSSNRSNQTLSKGFGAEGKKGQDVANKPWPRSGGRRREPTGGSFSTKNEQSRKPIPQRNKIVLDKRPKPRGGYYSASGLGGNEDARLTVEHAEIGSVFVQGSKKQSLNHLLNFHYTPRQNVNEGTSKLYRSASYRNQNVYKHKYNKEEFLQATCQFVVNGNGNYEINMKDPDILVNWDLVEQIHVQGSEFPCCPICLYLPVAAKMTRCGHIYCWSCILHYLALSDKTWRKCPICFESIHKQDLKSVIAKPYANVIAGNTITMRLMRRERGSLIAIPVDEIELRADSNTLLNVSENNIDTAYSKLLLAHNKEILAIIDRERKELNIQLSEDENCPEKCFIEQALELLAIREKNTLECSENSIGNLKAEKRSTIQFSVIENNSKAIDDNKEQDMASIPKCFYFYQANDGQHIYLHSLNIRILEHIYGNLENCPSTIEGVITEKESISMTDDLRKRMRYLQHLPITCQFEVAELEIKSPVINKEVLNHFKDQIEHRRKRRQKRARDERRHEKRIIEKENRLMGKYPIPNIHLESYAQFPNFMGSPEVNVISMESSPPLSSVTENSLSEIFGVSPDSSDDLNDVTNNLHISENTSFGGPSFANMLAKSKIENISWPTLKKCNGTPPPKLISVTGKNCRVGFDIAKQQHNDSDCEHIDGYVAAPAYNKSFSEAIAAALEQSDKQLCSDEKPSLPSSSASEYSSDRGGNKKKKKRNNRKLLFATSMACTGK